MRAEGGGRGGSSHGDGSDRDWPTETACAQMCNQSRVLHLGPVHRQQLSDKIESLFVCPCARASARMVEALQGADLPAMSRVHPQACIQLYSCKSVSRANKWVGRRVERARTRRRDGGGGGV
jgi:hypothetical protein